MADLDQKLTELKRENDRVNLDTPPEKNDSIPLAKQSRKRSRTAQAHREAEANRIGEKARRTAEAEAEVNALILEFSGVNLARNPSSACHYCSFYDEDCGCLQIVDFMGSIKKPLCFVCCELSCECSPPK